MWLAVLEAVIDSLKILPILFISYILIEIAQIYFSKRRRKSWSPLIAASLGLMPQCGFSVVATDLYSKKQLNLGALLAVFIATSDEAIPIMLSNPNSALSLLPLLLIKFVFAVIVGFAANAIFNKKEGVPQIPLSEDSFINSLREEQHHIGCCNHHIDKCEQNKWKRFLLHPFIHSIKIFIYVLIVNLIFGLIIYFVGEQSLINFLAGSHYLSPLLAVLIGLIPNCASSVIIAELFVLGGIPFGACVAGLCVNAGIAFVILFKQNKKLKQNLAILGSLSALSIILGYIILLIQPLTGL